MKEHKCPNCGVILSEELIKSLYGSIMGGRSGKKMTSEKASALARKRWDKVRAARAEAEGQAADAGQAAEDNKND